MGEDNSYMFDNILSPRATSAHPSFHATPFNPAALNQLPGRDRTYPPLGEQGNSLAHAGPGQSTPARAHSQGGIHSMSPFHGTPAVGGQWNPPGTPYQDAPSPPSSSDPLPPLFQPAAPPSSTGALTEVQIAAVAKDLNLDQAGVDSLRQFLNYAQSGLEPLSAALTKTLVMLMASSLQIQQAVFTNNSQNYRSILEDMKSILEASFKLSKEHEENIRHIVKHLLIEPNRRVFKDNLDTEVLVTITQERDVLQFKSVIGNDARQELVKSYARTAANSARNQLRANIYASIYGPLPGNSKSNSNMKGTAVVKHKMGIREFVVFMNSKWRRFNVNGYDDKPYIIQFALLRKVALDNKDLWGTEKNEAEEGEPVTDENTNNPPRTVPQKRKSPMEDKSNGQHGGSRGKGYFVRVEEYLETQIADKGPKFTSSAWNIFMQRIIEDDNKMFDPEACERQMWERRQRQGDILSVNGQNGGPPAPQLGNLQGGSLASAFAGLG